MHIYILKIKYTILFFFCFSAYSFRDLFDVHPRDIYEDSKIFMFSYPLIIRLEIQQANKVIIIPFLLYFLSVSASDHRLYLRNTKALSLICSCLFFILEWITLRVFQFLSHLVALHVWFTTQIVIHWSSLHFDPHVSLPKSYQNK